MSALSTYVPGVGLVTCAPNIAQGPQGGSGMESIYLGV